MPNEPELKAEIGHVLLIDIVGYSRLLIDRQSELLQTLKQIVRENPTVRAARDRRDLIRLPTGDGMALVFRRKSEAPVECALELSVALRNHPQLPLRMGVHSGPIHEIVDVNERANVAGAGIDLAQRVMDCGDAGHILVSKRVADDLAPYPRWHPLLHDLGETEVKHGMRLHLFNLCGDDFGNPAVPSRLRKTTPAVDAGPSRSVLRWLLPAAAVLVLLSLGGIAWWFVSRPQPVRPPAAVQTAPAIPEKSIAVLPFENFSDSKENEFFADGVQDDILTALSRIADLKVISRTSVMTYSDNTKRNLREIAQALAVSHILEGSVRRAGDKVRISAQLIDARTDAHLWAQTYDRDLADVFAIQSEIARTIADQLQARLSPREKAEIETAPTSNLAAFDLYTRAKALLARGSYSSAGFDYLTQAAELLNHAAAIDPNFFLAYCLLEFVHDNLYFQGLDRTPARRALGEAAVQGALRLRPDAGETHLAMAGHLYRVNLNYDGARAELEKAKETLPNSSQVYELTGYIDRRQGRWEDSIRNHRKALELDPRNYFVYQQISLSYNSLRQYPEMAAALDRALELVPDDVESRTARALVDLLWRGDTEPLHNTIRSVLAQDPGAASSIAELWFLDAMCRRDSADAERAVAALTSRGILQSSVIFPRELCEAEVARLRGDEQAAHEAFTRARAEMEARLQAAPDHGPTLVVLGLIDAGLGRKDDAIREGRRAAELTPVSKESLAGSSIIKTLALVYAWTGEKDLAFEQLVFSIRTPGGVEYGPLKLNPVWDSLRGDPRFEKIVASLAPKDAK